MFWLNELDRVKDSTDRNIKPVRMHAYINMRVCVCVCVGDSRASMALDSRRQSIYSVLRGAYKQMLSNFSQE